MINRLQLIRNVGQFDSMDGTANIALLRLTLIYAENGRGKTTLAAILRSLGTNDPAPIVERSRLGAAYPPHVVIDCTGGPPAAIFQNSAWNRSLGNIVVFDDQFVDQNVYSGLVVGPDHRQRLHELILGAQGIALNHRLQDLVTEIEGHNHQLRAKGNAIPTTERGALSVDDFCNLPARADIDAALQAAERNLAAARSKTRFGTPPSSHLSPCLRSIFRPSKRSCNAICLPLTPTRRCMSRSTWGTSGKEARLGSRMGSHGFHSPLPPGGRPSAHSALKTWSGPP